MASIEAAISGKKENYVSSSESEGEEEPTVRVPAPICDGLPQVSL